MRVVVIGAKGHIGTYLVPRLVESGFEVIAVTRGVSKPYSPNGAWKWVKEVCLDRTALEKEGAFGQRIAELKPDVVVDLINFEPESAVQMVEALRGKVRQYVYCSSVWAHGYATLVPAREDQPKDPICDYGSKKRQTELYLLGEARMGRFPATTVGPGHITGPGWTCINPAGNFNPRTFEKILRGEEIALPHFGMELMHHVHADDVAQVFHRAILRMPAAIGEDFYAVAPQAITLRGLTEVMFRYFGHEPRIRFLPWAEWCAETLAEEPENGQGYINSTYSHLTHSDVYTCDKARTLLGYHPRYSIPEAVQECADSLIARGVITA